MILEFYNYIIIQYIDDCERTFMKKIPKTDKVRQSKTTCIELHTCTCITCMYVYMYMYIILYLYLYILD